MRNATAPKTPSFASLVQQFFTEYLVAQRALSIGMRGLQALDDARRQAGGMGVVAAHAGVDLENLHGVASREAVEVKRL